MQSHMELVELACSSGVSAAGVSPAPIRKRRFSSAKIQPTRVKKVMQSDEEIGRMVASVPVAIGRAMEHFAEKLLEAAALCVQCSTSRTLSPVHMKQAVMQNRHFAFLEPLMREIPMPGRTLGEMSWPMELNQHSQPLPQHMIMPGPMPMPEPYCGNEGAAQPSALVLAPPPYMHAYSGVSVGTIVGAKRRLSNGAGADSPDGKPKRGRPRKLKKGDRCVDDDGVLIETKDTPSQYHPASLTSGAPANGILESASMIDGATSSGTKPEPQAVAQLSDAELMPPPMCLPARLSSDGGRTTRLDSGARPPFGKPVVCSLRLPPRVPAGVSFSLDPGRKVAEGLCCPPAEVPPSSASLNSAQLPLPCVINSTYGTITDTIDGNVSQ